MTAEWVDGDLLKAYRDSSQALDDVVMYLGLERVRKLLLPETAERVDSAVTRLRMISPRRLISPEQGAAVFTILVNGPTLLQVERAALSITEPYVLMEWRNHSGPPGALKYGASAPYRWVFIGGKIEPGEDAEMCMRREAREELGIIVRNHFRVPHPPIYADGHQDDPAWRVHPFLIMAYEGQPKQRTAAQIQLRPLAEVMHSESESTALIARAIYHEWTIMDRLSTQAQYDYRDTLAIRAAVGPCQVASRCTYPNGHAERCHDVNGNVLADAVGTDS